MYDGQVRVTAIDATETVREAQRRQGTLSAASAGLGRMLVGTLLLASDIKDEATVTVQMAGNGPAGKVVANANGKLQGRGYVDRPEIGLPLNDQGKLDVRGALGSEGTFTVIKDLGLKEPFSGQVPIVSGEVAEDFTYYLAVSEQIPSAVGLGVLVAPDEHILQAGGWLLQALPGASEECLDELERAVAETPHITKLLAAGERPVDIIHRLAGDAGEPKILAERPVSFHCPCSKERFKRGLIALGPEELTTLIEEDGEAEAVCHFCNEKYHFDQGELVALRQEALQKED